MRLIDADKLYKYLDDIKYPCDKYAEVEDILEIIKDQPTVKETSIDKLHEMCDEIECLDDLYK